MDYQTLIEDAHREGMAALNECRPNPHIMGPESGQNLPFF